MIWPSRNLGLVTDKTNTKKKNRAEQEPCLAHSRKINEGLLGFIAAETSLPSWQLYYDCLFSC